MIKASELRICNYVFYEDNYAMIESIEKNFVGIHYKSKNGLYISIASEYPEHIFPIPLSPEILEKAGFKFKCNDFYTKNDIVSFSYEKGIGFYQTWVLGDNLINNILYLHQLQNLYYALTGEELEINL